MDNEISRTFGRIIEASCPSSMVRAIESGKVGGAELWATIEESGFLNALVAEDAGGVGLTLADTAELLMLVGRHGVPLPVAETIMLRGMLADCGMAVPKGSLTFGGHAYRDRDGVFCQQVVCGETADHAVVAQDGTVRILALNGCRILNTQALAQESGARWATAQFETGDEVSGLEVNSLPYAQAMVHSLQLAGAMEAVLEQTISYAGERVQFGKPIAKFQAIQHQLAVMAEHVIAARMAAILACQAGLSDRMRIAIAKVRCGMAAVEVAGFAHSIHGAIGFTEEYDLHLLTRRLHLWRQLAGSELFWEEEIGRMALAGGECLTLDILRKASEPAE